MEDWALIRRLVADGVPQRQVARDLGIGRSTVARALASGGPPKYEQPSVATTWEPSEPGRRVAGVCLALQIWVSASKAARIAARRVPARSRAAARSSRPATGSIASR